MEGLAEFIPILVQTGDHQVWNNYLQSCNELKVFVKKPNESVPLINSLLNETETRVHGLSILEVFLKQSSRSIINEHIVYWFYQCLKGVAQPSSSLQSSRSYVVLSVLLEFSTEFPDVKKQTSQVFIPKILDSIVDKFKESPQNSNVILKCLLACLSNYGKSCGNYKNDLEKIFVKLLVTYGCPINLVVKCFHLLAQCGAPGNETINYMNNWHSQHLIIINSLHFILDQLFSDVSEILSPANCSETEKRTLDLPLITDESPVIKAHKLRHWFSSLCLVLESMLLDSFPACKKIHSEAVLGVVCRSLEVTYKSLESKISNSMYALMVQLQDIHISSIKLLSSLILSTRSNLLPLSSLISKLFIQIFKWTSVEDWPQDKKRPFSSLRQAVYKCLLHWLTIGKSCSFVDPQVNVIIESIIKDIKCCKKTVKLNLEKKSARKGGRKSTSMSESAEKLEMGEEMCYAALSCLPLILRTPISSSVVKKIQEVIVQLIFEIQRASGCEENFPPPYTSSRCRALLYSALLSLCMSPHPQFPPPLHYANFLFSSAASDNNVEVIRTCSFALSCIGHMLRPSAPSFDFQSDLDSEVIPINAIPDSPLNVIKPTLKISLRDAPKKNIKNTDVKKHNGKSRNPMATVNRVEQISIGGNNSVTPYTHSIEMGNDELSTVDDSVHDSNDDLIDLAESSDDSLVLLDSEKKIDLSTNYVNLEDNNRKTIIIPLAEGETSKRVKRRTKDKETNSETEISGENVSKKSHTSQILSDNQTNKYSGPSNRSTRSSKHSEKDILVPPVHAIKISGNSSADHEEKYSDEDIIITESSQESPKKEKGSNKNLKFKSSAVRLNRNAAENPNVSVICDEDISIIEQDTALKRVTRSNKTSICSEIADINSNDSCETKISEDISIIESVTTLSPRSRSKRNYLSSPNSKTPDSSGNTNEVNLNDDILIISDETEPPSKRLRSSQLLLDSQEKGSVESSCDLTVVSNEVDEMLDSFIDSVPE